VVGVTESMVWCLATSSHRGCRDHCQVLLMMHKHHDLKRLQHHDKALLIFTL